jgi:hypothetical protein
MRRGGTSETENYFIVPTIFVDRATIAAGSFPIFQNVLKFENGNLQILKSAILKFGKNLERRAFFSARRRTKSQRKIPASHARLAADLARLCGRL